MNYSCLSSIDASTASFCMKGILTSPCLTSSSFRVNRLLSNFFGIEGTTLHAKFILVSSSIFRFSLMANLSSISWKFIEDSEIIYLGATGLFETRHSCRSNVAIILKSYEATL